MSINGNGIVHKELQGSNGNLYPSSHINLPMPMGAPMAGSLVPLDREDNLFSRPSNVRPFEYVDLDETILLGLMKLLALGIIPISG